MDWLDDNLGWIIVAIVAVGIGFCIWIGVSDENDPHISLNKTEWHCSHTHTVLIPISTGKTVVLVPEEICDTYRMNGYE